MHGHIKNRDTLTKAEIIKICSCGSTCCSIGVYGSVLGILFSLTKVLKAGGWFLTLCQAEARFLLVIHTINTVTTGLL